MKILISPWSRKLRNEGENPKNYPYWNKVIEGIKEHKNIEVWQIGVKDEIKLQNVDKYFFDKKLKEIQEIVLSCDTWCSVDNFFPHFCNLFNSYGVVIFSQSDPNIFGYSSNVNILENRSYLRKNQFDIWERCEYIKEAYVSPLVVVDEIMNKLLSCLFMKYIKLETDEATKLEEGKN